jgi:flagellar biosynthesis protein FliR
MLTLSGEQLQALVVQLLWPLARILGLIAASPLFGNRSVPARLKIGLGILLTVLIAPLVPPGPAQDPVGWDGLLITMQQVIIGLALGFTMRIVFVTVEIAGEIIGLTMGLGFATFFDPQSQGRSSSISQFLALMATMTFLSINGHLLILAALTESFTSLPISASPFHAIGFFQIAQWGSKIFSTGVQLSLPIVASLLITNVALAILTRAAPQLNIFGIGFPLALGIGFILVWLILPYMAVPLENLFQAGFEKMRQIARVLGGAPVK